MTTEYKIVEVKYASGDYRKRLIGFEAVKETPDLKDFFERADDIIELKIIGTIQVLGDTDYMDDSYLAD